MLQKGLRIKKVDGVGKNNIFNGAKLRIVFERKGKVFGMFLQAKITSVNRSIIFSQEKELSLSINLSAN